LFDRLLKNALRECLSNDHARGLALAVTGILILTPDSLLIRLITADHWSLLFWRGLMTFVTLALWLFYTDRRNTLTRFQSIGGLGLVVALLFALNTSLFVISIRHTAVANTLVLLSAAPLFAAVFSSLFLREHAPLRTWIATLIGIASIAFIMADSLGAANLIGDGAALAVTINMAAILTLMRYLRSNNAIPIVALSGLLLAIAMLLPSQPLSLSGSDWFYMGVLGLVVIPVSFALTLAAPRYLPAPEVGLIFLLETVLGPFLVWLVLGEEPPVATLIGGVVLVTTLVAHAALSMRKAL
jgi:drug/metabolite transporter (DMT)-like permease